MADFERRKEVVCVRDDWGQVARHFATALPVAGRKYLIRDTRVVHWLGHDILSIALDELVNAPIETGLGFVEPYFAVCQISGEPNFRPVIEHKTDISVFDYHLTPTNVRTPERV